jgi:SAM-dependent methyltransferase
MHQKTRDTYNQSADSLSNHYDEIGPREGDINLAFTLSGNPANAVVLEIGCGNGRDARAIIRRSGHYTGIDTSESMIDLARQKVPSGQFRVADALSFEYEGPYDIVFAFAAFRHMNPDELTTVLKQIHASLKTGGVLYVSSNHADSYRSEARNDKYGTRIIHYYNPKLLQQRAPRGLKKIQEIFDTVDGQEWFEVAFQKA